MSKFITRWLPVILWMGLIYYLSSKPGLAIGEGAVDFCTRKPAHIAEYGALFLLFFRAIKGSSSWERWEVAVGAGVLSFLYALTDEFHQYLVPLREARLYDLGFDLLGIAVGVLFLHVRRRKRS